KVALYNSIEKRCRTGEGGRRVITPTQGRSCHESDRFVVCARRRLWGGGAGAGGVVGLRVEVRVVVGAQRLRGAGARVGGRPGGGPGRARAALRARGLGPGRGARAGGGEGEDRSAGAARGRGDGGRGRAAAVRFPAGRGGRGALGDGRRRAAGGAAHRRRL